jgi:predicted Holliday junction resolvase-like endonuclease
METNIWIFVIILAAILLFVTALALIIGYFWASSKTKSTLLKQQETIFKQAQEQLQNWKEQELTTIKQQTFDAAKGQVIQEMQEQVQKWQQNELQQIRQQMLEGVRGEAIKEAQQQLVIWRTGELEKAKGQIWEVLTKEAKVSFEQWKVAAEKEIRQDAIGKSQSVTIGKMTEHIVPYLPGFRYNPADARFIGSPIDFVVFDGLGDDDVRKIVFVEIKTGASSLSTRERSVRNAVQDRKIEWLEIKVNLDNPEIIREHRSRRNNKRTG